MNYLAHSFLSSGKPELIVGNFIADHIHGNNFAAYPAEIIEGVKLHRQIDSFTDSHEKFKESKRFFYNGYEKYSGILIDIYFDHLLARNFSSYSPVPLNDYCTSVYAVYKSYGTLLPKGSAKFLNYVLENNVYFGYSTIEGIERVLLHLSHRVGHGIWLQDSISLFKEHETQLNQNFEIFFKDALTQFIIKPN